MKISGLEKSMLALTAAVLLFSAGYFAVGRAGTKPYAVDTQIIRTETVGEGVLVSARPDSVNINTASVEQLQTLPGIGLTKAQSIVDDRQANGPFRIPEDLIRVSGIGEGTLNEILAYITVE